MGQIAGPETLIFNLNHTPGNYPKEDNLNTLNHVESLKFNILVQHCVLSTRLQQRYPLHLNGYPAQFNVMTTQLYGLYATSSYKILKRA